MNKPTAFNISPLERSNAEAILKVIYDNKNGFMGHFVGTIKQSSNISNRKKTEFNPTLDEAFISALDSGITDNRKQFYYIKDYVKERNIDVSDECITSFIERKYVNLHSRRRRFIEKASMQSQLKGYVSFFVTWTYDDKKQTEESFRKRIKKLCGNLHTRNGWKVMGVFERAPETGRLHFHGLVYCKPEKMVGQIITVREYNPLTGRVEEHHSNSFFLERFGRNDFAPITCKNLEDLKLYHDGKTNQQVIDYILKYILKSGEYVFYTRGIASYFETPYNESRIASDYIDFVQKFVLFDDILDTEPDVVFMRC